MKCRKVTVSRQNRQNLGPSILEYYKQITPIKIDFIICTSYSQIMFHHQKSSRSSDENLQINLLYEKDRDSRINMVRIDRKDLKNHNIMHNLKRGSQKVARRTSFEEDLQPNIYDNYSALEINNFDASESILTNASHNNSFIGFLLFALLFVFTPLQTFSLYGSQQTLGIQTPIPMLIFLIACQLIAFGVLYSCHWVERISLLKSYLFMRKRSHPSSSTLISKIINRPWVLFLIVALLTIIWQISYACSILEHDEIGHLILFYVIILPQIAGSLIFEEQLYKSKALKVLFFGVLVYLAVVAFLVNQWLLYTGITGVLLIYLSIRAGRMCLFMQYITKIIMMATFTIVYFISYSSEQENDYQQGPPIFMIFLLAALTSICIIIVRCVNNKILRVELYKYFYSDSTINNAILCLPFILGYIQNQVFDVSVGAIGCGILLIITYLLGQFKEEIIIQPHIQDRII